MERIQSSLIQAVATRLEAIEQRVDELGPQASGSDSQLRDLTGFNYKKGSNKATFNAVISSQTYNFAKKMLEDMENHDEVHISVNSPGGSAVAGIALYNLFNEADQKIIMTATGQAYSAAGVMMQGADERRIAQGSYLGVHRSWCRAVGNEGDMNRLATELRKSDENIMEIFSSVAEPGMAGKIKEYMNKDTALTGRQAVEVGLADKVLTRKTKPKTKASAEETPKEEAKASAEVAQNAAEINEFIKAQTAQLEELNKSLQALREETSQMNFGETKEKPVNKANEVEETPEMNLAETKNAEEELKQEAPPPKAPRKFKPLFQV